MKNSKPVNTSKREFLKKAGVTTTAAGAASLAAPAIIAAEPIKWRLQTYAGSALGQHVTKPAVDAINNASNGELQV